MIIDTNVPIPDSHPGRPKKYQWSQMNVGDSVFFVDEPKTSQSNPAMSSRTYARINGRKFVSRKEGSGVRIWRTQ